MCAIGKVPHLGVHPGVRVYTQVFGVLPVYSGCICEARREPLRRSGGALCSRVAPCWGSRGCSQTQGRPMGQPQGGCAAFLRAARCAQRRKTANAHFEPLAVEFPRSFLARGGSTRYGREHAPPMNICWAVVVVNPPRTAGRRFPPNPVRDNIRPSRGKEVIAARRGGCLTISDAARARRTTGKAGAGASKGWGSV